LGLDLLVSQVQNTELKQPKVSKNIPTVASVTQGEVILFAAKAVETMGKDGLVVLLEGREQTVNYVRTPHRFTLMLSDGTLIGKRRAAQRIMAEALKSLEEGASNDKVQSVLEECLAKMVSEIEPN
jgi:predicted XRE-type DNA-binding protein